MNRIVANIHAEIKIRASINDRHAIVWKNTVHTGQLVVSCPRCGFGWLVGLVGFDKLQHLEINSF